MGCCRITVLKRMENPDLAGQYCQAGESVCPCQAFHEGQVFISDGAAQPANFCSWAWDDISKYVLLFESGGNMKVTYNYAKTDTSAVACCTDGIRPVVFLIEKITT